MSTSASPTTERRTSSVQKAADRLVAASLPPGKAAFAARAMNALAKLTAAIDERSLSEAAGAASDFDVLTQVLSDPAAARVLNAEDPLAAARAGGVRAKQKLLQAEGGMLGAGQVAELLGVTRQAVDKRRRAGRLIGVRAGRREWGYPAWQFTSDGRALANLEQVLCALQHHDSIMQIAFFLSGNVWLESETPLNALRGGRIAEVIRAAEAYGEHTAT